MLLECSIWYVIQAYQLKFILAVKFSLVAPQTTAKFYSNLIHYKENLPRSRKALEHLRTGKERKKAFGGNDISTAFTDVIIEL